MPANLFVAALCVFAAAARLFGAEIPEKQLPLPGETFGVNGRAAFLIPAPLNAAKSAKPWVWYAPTLPGLPAKEEQWMFEQFLASGIAVGGIDVGESYGSLAGRKLFSEFHAALVARGYSSKPVLLGRSRGGLMLLSWAAENPGKTGGFAGIYPVCNLASYPGIAKAAPAFGLAPEQLEASLAEHNPIDRLAPLARAGVPLFAIHGDVDALVPLELNSGLVKKRYTELGGSMQLIVPPGQGHNMWAGFFQCSELVEFVRSHSGPILTLNSPQDFEVVQRRSKKKGTLLVKGDFRGPAVVVIEARIIAAGKAAKWRKVGSERNGRFQARIDGPAGGWHRVEVRARSGGQIVAESAVAHVGIGEVFVVAGQSNSANHGEEKQKTVTGLVASFDGTRWQLAHDPQPGASGNGGSFMPPFGDAIARRFKVPVGIVACGVGATSVREWLPKGAVFPNPPTLLGNVQQLPNGEWESKGTIYASFISRLKPLGPRGFRTILWHQGESDANQQDPSRTLAGPLYTASLKNLIVSTRRDLGWEPPWFVAQATYHVPGDESSPEIRGAQAALWEMKLALPGPDTDALKGALRDSGGRGVHFSGDGLREHAALWAAKVSPWLEKAAR